MICFRCKNEVKSQPWSYLPQDMRHLPVKSHASIGGCPICDMASMDFYFKNYWEKCST